MGHPCSRCGEDTVMSTIDIDSGDVLADTEHHFRVTAGPGAGKTYWLVNHIQHVVRTSKRLTSCSRVAVLSYTNVAVREIICRLGPVANSVDVSTIHSFLFRNVVRPYLHLLKNPEGGDLVAHHLVNTHGEHYPSRKHLDEWITANGQAQLRAAAMKKSYNRVRELLREIAVRIDNNGNAYLMVRGLDAAKRDKNIAALFQHDVLVNYKRRYWQDGTIDHEDVLYFAHRLLNWKPMICRFLSTRFPYLFVDEFQDTIPVQAVVVRWLAEQGTIVGVIGDPEQAIFGFLDASPRHFREFSLVGHHAYSIPGNRRSTDTIVRFLNAVRADGLVQEAVRAVPGPPITVYGGDLTSAIAEAQKTAGEPSKMLILARTHSTLLRARNDGAAAKKDPWKQLEEADVDRCRLLNHMAVSVDLAKRGLFDLAIQRLVQGISSRQGYRKPFEYTGPSDVITRRGLTLFLLETVMAGQNELLDKTALDFYDLLQKATSKCDARIKLPKVQNGRGFHVAASACSYASLFDALRTLDPVGTTRVIHQAKGAEADAVFVILEEEHLDHILSPTPNNEEQRTTYVALSRARDNLSLFCPKPERLADFAKLHNCTISLLPAH